MSAYKVNKQVFLGGQIIGVGVYDESRIPHSSNVAKFIEGYCNNQKSLPLEKKDIPPYFEILGGNGQQTPQTPEQKVEQKVDNYVGMGKKKLLELARQKGLKVNNKMSEKELIEVLVESDKVEINNDANKKFVFKSGDEFVAMPTEEQVNYLDGIFALPDGVEDGSEEETEYINSMTEAVTEYSGLSLEQEVIDKIKEILDYVNGEE